MKNEYPILAKSKFFVKQNFCGNGGETGAPRCIAVSPSGRCERPDGKFGILSNFLYLLKVL
jgi:hypothetical protein